MKKFTLFYIIFNLRILLTAATYNGGGVYEIDDYETSVHAYDSVTINANNGADISFYNAYDSSVLNTFSTVVISHLHLYDHSSASINDASISHLSCYNNSIVNISEGDFSYINLYDLSVANISNLEGLSYLYVNNGAVAWISCTNAVLNDKTLTGNWLNGNPFTFTVNTSPPDYSGDIVFSEESGGMIKISANPVLKPIEPEIFQAVGIRFQTEGGYVYQVEKSYDLEYWVDHREPIIGNGEIYEVFEEQTSGVFYRVEVKANLEE